MLFAGLNSIKNPQNYRPPPRRGIQAAVEFPRQSRGNPAKTKPRRSRGRVEHSGMFRYAGQTGFEPVIFPVTGGRDNQVTLLAHN